MRGGSCDIAQWRTAGQIRDYERDLPQRDECHALRQHFGEFHCSLCADSVPIEAESGKGKQLATQCRCMRLPVCRSPMAHEGLLLGQSALQIRDLRVREGSSDRFHARHVVSVDTGQVVTCNTATQSTVVRGVTAPARQRPTPGLLGARHCPMAHFCARIIYTQQLMHMWASTYLSSLSSFITGSTAQMAQSPE